MANGLYPAISDEDLDAVCGKLAAAFGLPPFALKHRSEHLETATASSGTLTISVTRFLGTLDAEQARTIERRTGDSHLFLDARTV